MAIKLSPILTSGTDFRISTNPSVILVNEGGNYIELFSASKVDLASIIDDRYGILTPTVFSQWLSLLRVDRYMNTYSINAGVIITLGIDDDDRYSLFVIDPKTNGGAVQAYPIINYDINNELLNYLNPLFTDSLIQSGDGGANEYIEQANEEFNLEMIKEYSEQYKYYKSSVVDLLYPTHITDYASFSSKMTMVSTGESIILAKDPFFHDYDQMYYLDDLVENVPATLTSEEKPGTIMKVENPDDPSENGYYEYYGYGNGRVQDNTPFNAWKKKPADYEPPVGLTVKSRDCVRHLSVVQLKPASECEWYDFRAGILEEIIYVLDHTSEEYSRAVQPGDCIELVIEFMRLDEVYTSTVYLSASGFKDTVDGETEVFPYIQDIYGVIRVEVDDNCIVIYSLSSDITEYRVVSAKLINSEEE